MAETKTEFRKVKNLGDIPLDNLRNEPITIGYLSKCQRYYYTANLLEHDKNYLYMGSGDNHLGCCKMSEMHLFGRFINGVHRFRKSEIDVIVTLEAKIKYVLGERERIGIPDSDSPFVQTTTALSELHKQRLQNKS